MDGWSVRGDGVHVISHSGDPKESKLFLSTNGLLKISLKTMAEQRMTYWAADAEVDEDLEDVDLNLAIGSFGQTDLYEDGVSKKVRIIHLTM